MARGTELRAVSGIMVDGKFTEIKDLSDKDREEWRSRALERLGKAFGEHFQQHPEKLADFVKQPGVTVEPL